jgi:hypothetical protein
VLPKLVVLRSRTTQAVARPSEVNERRQETANADRSTCRSEAVWRKPGQLTISARHIYDI